MTGNVKRWFRPQNGKIPVDLSGEIVLNCIIIARNSKLAVSARNPVAGAAVHEKNAAEIRGN
jgi:hypothetical protein